MARRYFQMSPDQWFSLPWWEAEILLDGLVRQFGNGSTDKSPGPAAPPPSGKEKINIASANLNELGFITTRRAG